MKVQNMNFNEMLQFKYAKKDKKRSHNIEHKTP